MDPCSAPVRDRTDRCPGVLRLHAAADGAMARVRLPGGRVGAAGLEAIAALAVEHGNGLVELTSRASVQIRGLSAGAHEPVAARLARAGLLPSLAHDRVRNVLTSPFGGRLPASVAATDDVVAALDAGLCADATLASLPGRFLFAVDDGSAVGCDERADVALAADAPGRFRLWLGGLRTSLVADAAGAPQLALDAARAFLAPAAEHRVSDKGRISPTIRHAPAAEGRAWRVADVQDAPARIARALGGELAPGAGSGGAGHAPAPGVPVGPGWRGGGGRAATPRAAIGLGGGGGLAGTPGAAVGSGAAGTPGGGADHAPAQPRRLDAGVCAQADGRVAVTALAPLGRLSPAMLRRLARLAPEVRISTRRTTTIVDVRAGDADRILAELDAAGFITAAGSGWHGLSACAGLGACSSAHADVRAAAAERARQRAASAPAEHWMACARGCGRPVGASAGAGAGVGDRAGTGSDDRTDDSARAGTGSGDRTGSGDHAGVGVGAGTGVGDRAGSGDRADASANDTVAVTATADGVTIERRGATIVVADLAAALAALAGARA
ncbi:MAG: precorrin-3B synthase [Solirubrobacteraceae bacterium]|nr:precorrin-3B synthase [Solirubrobacteraceae bacterium]